MRVHFRWFKDPLVSPCHLESSTQVFGGSALCHQLVLATVAPSLCVLTRGAGTGLGSREETGAVDLSIIVYFSKWPLSGAAVWWHSFSPDKAHWQRSLHVQGTC